MSSEPKSCHQFLLKDITSGLERHHCLAYTLCRECRKNKSYFVRDEQRSFAFAERPWRQCLRARGSWKNEYAGYDLRDPSDLCLVRQRYFGYSVTHTHM